MLLPSRRDVCLSALSLITASGLAAPQRAQVSVKAYGATGDGRHDDTKSIQAAIDRIAARGGGAVYFPAGIYRVTDRIHLKSNVRLHGDGARSILKVGKAAGFAVLNVTYGDIKNIIVERLSFDGSVNYPVNSRVYKQTYSRGTQAINVQGVAVSGLVVRNCAFRNIAGRSIHVQSDAARNLTFANNRFEKGAYTGQVIYVRPAAPEVRDSIRPSGIEISGNEIIECGPQYHWDPSLEDWCASADGIALDRCRNFRVAGNKVRNTASIGIRIEECVSGSVENNQLTDIGSDGIACYKNSRSILITGNTIRNWGKIPPIYVVRRYRGRYVYATEFPELPSAPLPLNPLTSGWFADWPYSTAGANVGKIKDYSPADYYRASSAGILPFRGYAAISINFGTTDCKVVSNLCIGSLAKQGGRYLHASDYGFSTVHPVNANGLMGAGTRTSVAWNRFSAIRIRALYAPSYQDPRHKKGRLGSVKFRGNATL